jgi:hypothetical protein
LAIATFLLGVGAAEDLEPEAAAELGEAGVLGDDSEDAGAELTGGVGAVGVEALRVGGTEAGGPVAGGVEAPDADERGLPTQLRSDPAIITTWPE